MRSPRVMLIPHADETGKPQAASSCVSGRDNRRERGCGMPHAERHRSERIGWLRAAVLGANDGIVSTASLVVGVAAAASARQEVLIAGVAALSRARSRWPLANMSRSALKPTRNRRI